MRIYHLNNEQKKLLAEFAKDAMEEMICDLADDAESPLDPYDQTGNFDRGKMRAMLEFIADEIRSRA